MTKPKPTLRRRIARLALAIAGFAGVWACNAPFIPVPPPDHITFTKGMLTDGTGVQRVVWITNGAANSQASAALFYVFDTNRDVGVIVRAGVDGSFQAPAFEGTEGDRIRIYFQPPAGENSDEACRLLQEGPDPPRCLP